MSSNLESALNDFLQDLSVELQSTLPEAKEIARLMISAVISRDDHLVKELRGQIKALIEVQRLQGQRVALDNLARVLEALLAMGIAVVMRS